MEPTHTPLRTWALRALAVLGVLLATLAAAQDRPSLERTRDRLLARLAADAGDTGALCELGLVQHRLGEPAARATLDRAIARLLAPRTTALDRRLAACLYNRGLVLEAAGDPEGARADYARSLALRSNATVRARLAALPPSALGTVERAGASSRAPGAVSALFGPRAWNLLAHATLGRGPLREAWLVSVLDDDDDGDESTQLVARRGDTLVSAPIDDCRGDVSTSFALELAPGPRGGVAFLIRARCLDAGREEGEGWETRTEVVALAWLRADGTLAQLQAGESSTTQSFDSPPPTRVDVWPGPDGHVAIDVIRSSEPDEHSRIVDLGAL